MKVATITEAQRSVDSKLRTSSHDASGLFDYHYRRNAQAAIVDVSLAHIYISLSRDFLFAKTFFFLFFLLYISYTKIPLALIKQNYYYYCMYIHILLVYVIYILCLYISLHYYC